MCAGLVPAWLPACFVLLLCSVGTFSSASGPLPAAETAFYSAVAASEQPAQPWSPTAAAAPAAAAPTPGHGSGGGGSNASAAAGAKPPVPPPKVDYDFFILSMFNPPAFVPVIAHGRAQHAISRHEAYAGFWTHGLWPVSHDVKILEFCGTEPFNPAALSGFETSLRYYLRSGDMRLDATGDAVLWDHEWLRHGTCSNMAQLEYFMAVFRASSTTDPAAVMRAAGLRPSNSQPYKLQQVVSVLSAAYGDSFNTHIGLRCAPATTDPSRNMLLEVRICLSKTDFKPYNCSKYAEWVRPGIKLDTCGVDPAAIIWVPDFDDTNAGVGFPWRLLGIFGGAALLLALGMAGAYFLLKSANKLPCVFVPRKVQLVHYNLVHTPVKILCEPLDMAVLWEKVPYIAEFVEDLPVGMGIKGGIARKLLKEMYGTPEPSGSYDIDVAVFIHEYTTDDRRAARELVTGLRLGGLVLEAKDVEVLTKAWLYEYFTSRDVTMNEVLIIKQAPGQAMFYYTRDALRDVQLQLIRPCVHTLKSEYNLNWAVEDDGTPYVSPSQVCRCLVRYLKGHGIDYAFDAGTWAHYRREKLTKLQLFKALRPFHDDSVKLQTAVDHLVEIGFLARRDVLRAGGVNLLWGLLLADVNSAIVATNAGTRLTLGELDADGVEAWVDHKKAQVASKLIALEMRGRRTGFMPAYGGVQELGLLHVPQELKDYIASGPIFDMEARLELETNTAIRALAGDGAVTLPAAAGAGNGAGDGSAQPVSIANTLRGMWATQRAVAENSSNAILSIAQHKFVAPSETPPAASWLGTSPQLAELLTSPDSQQDPRSGNSQSSNHGKPIDPAKRRLEHLSSLKKLAIERQNKAFKQSGGAGISRTGSNSLSTRENSASNIEAAAESSYVAAEAAAVNAPLDEEPADHEAIWLRYSDVGLFTQADDLAQAKLGTFYQVLDAASGLEGEGDKEFSELITNDQRPQRQRPTITRLLNFAFGVAFMNVSLLAAAYGLLLLAMVFRLAMPKVEGAIFDAFNSFAMVEFRRDLLLAVTLVVLEVVFSVSGHVVLELFARHTMSRLFAQFFDHILSQELTFFNKLPAGELMARTSGDSLTLRTMFTSAAYQLVEGGTLLLGAAACLAVTLGPLWVRSPSIVLALMVGLGLSGLEAFVTGLAARVLNQRVRQSLGRMFGFSLDIFSKMATVSSLGLQSRLFSDYTFFARDYFRNTFNLNMLLAIHRSYTYAIGALIRAAMLWFGGVALFADLTTVGTVFMMLRYATIMQRGIKQASDSYARIMASLGSLERVVELHDRGVFRDAAKSLGREEIPIPEEDDWDEAAAAGAGSGLRAPLLQKLKNPWHHKKQRVRVELLPEEPRPDFGQMMGGVRLEDIYLTLRSKTDRLVLKDASLTLLKGQAAIITSVPGGGKSSLLQLVMLHHMPYKGYITFQLPLSAIPPEAVAAGAAWFQRGDVDPPTSGAGESLGRAPGSITTPGTAAHSAAAAAAMGPCVQPGGEGWVWAQFSMLKDDQKAARSCMAMASVSAAGLFRTTVEDNVACACLQPVTGTEVRAACNAVGAHDFIMALPEGYRTLVGDGSGTIISPALLLKLTLARALVRKPVLLLLDDGDQFANAVGRQRLNSILAGLQAQGVTIIMASDAPALFSGFRRQVYRIDDGSLHLVEGEGQ